MSKNFTIKQHVWCTNLFHNKELGVVAEVHDDGYMVMFHKNGKMYFEKLIAKEMELDRYETIRK